MSISCDPSDLANAAFCFPTCPVLPPVDPLDGLGSWGYMTFGNLGGITSITFNQTSSIPGFDIESDTELVSLSFPNLVSIDPTNIQNGYLLIEGCTRLATLSMPVFVPNNGDQYMLDGNAFNAASVNAFLARCVANAGFVSGQVDLSGGTSAAPTGQGIADKATLTGRGVTMFTN